MFGYIFAIFLTLSDTFCQQILNLSVDRTEIILCPGCDGIIKFRR